MPSIKVSICIPTYNQVLYLKKLLDSIANQTFKDFEIVITDDSPDDAVLNLIKSYQFGSKIKYFKNSSRLGPPKNWNESIRQASGQYIKIMHHDDWFTYNDSLEQFVQMMDSNPESDLAFSSVLVHNDFDGSQRLHNVSEDKIEKLKYEPTSIFFSNLIGPPSAIIFKKIINQYFDEELKWIVDIDFFIKILLKNNLFVNVSKPLITSTIGAKHNVTHECTNNSKLNIFEYFHVYNKIKNNIAQKNKIRYLRYLWAIMNNFHIMKIKDIRECGYLNEIPMRLRIGSFLNYFSNFYADKFVRMIAVRI